MKQGIAGVALIAASVLGLLVINSAYVIDETQQAVITQFGEPVGQPNQTPGLHWKTPFTQVVHKFDKRILEWDGYPSEVPTRDKKFIWVDVTGRWRIEDPLKFLQTMHNERNAQSRLDDIMDGITRNFITRHNLVDVVRDSNRILEAKVEAEDIAADTALEKIEEGRETITRRILETARGVVKEYGIELIDLRIKRINYIQSVQQKVFERMISERKRSAEQMRSEGQGVRAEIKGQMDKELKRITSEAYKQVQSIRGKADAEATRIYAAAYSKDPAFYDFLATMEMYPEALKGSKAILSTDSDFLKYLKTTEA
jgi:modulator of FtsH protease HflC